MERCYCRQCANARPSSSKDADECVRDLDGRRFDGARLIVEFAKDKDTPGERAKHVRGCVT